MKLDNAFLQVTMDQTLPNRGLLCFGPLNSKVKRYILKEKVKSAKKRIFRRKKSEENAENEFEIRRFPSTTILITNQNQSQIYQDVRESLKNRQFSALDNLKLQSRVYRDEIDSLKRQIDCLRKEKIQLENPAPEYHRRRSNFM